MKDEQWRPIPRYHGYYEASDMGHIQNVGFDLRGKRRKRRPPRPLMTHRQRGVWGQYSVTLSRSGERRTFRVAHLILITFEGKPRRGQYPHHKDGNPANNQLSNLEWGWGDESLRARWHPEDIKEVFKLYYKEGYTLREIGLMYGVTHPTISSLIKRYKGEYS